MFAKDTLITTAVLALASTAAAAPRHAVRADDNSTPATDAAALSTKLQTATGPERYALLPQDSDFVFDFNTSPVPIADRTTFPALSGLGAAMALGSLPACGMSFVHLHPRASEIFAMTSGERVLTQTVPELGAGPTAPDGRPRVIRAELSPGQATVFPAGAFHTQVNPTCTEASFAAGFGGSDDPGFALPAAQTFQFDDGIVEASLGGSVGAADLERIRAAIPREMVIMVERCREECGMGEEKKGGE